MAEAPRKSALVLEGGGMRGVFAAGVLNAFGTSHFDPFDLYLGVSAGACNLASHLAGQTDRNYEIMRRYSSTARFISFRRFVLGGHLMDLDWLWEVTIREYRLDLKRLFERLQRQNKEYIVVVTAMDSGRAIYLQPAEETLEHYLKVSSSVPIAYRNMLEIDGMPATDGGVADSIPVFEAHRREASDITVVRTRPRDYIKRRSRSVLLYRALFGAYPGFVEAMRTRHKRYMQAVEFIRQPPRGIKVREIAPPHEVATRRTTRDLGVLRVAYECGIECGKRFVAEW